VSRCFGPPAFKVTENQTVRVAAFILRAILASSEGAKENDGIVISETIFLALGIVSILYSTFLLVLER
jgi:hypothetical protein